MKTFRLFLFGMLFSSAVFAQAISITHPDGSPLAIQYCHADTNYVLVGQPVGGTFNGCGVIQLNGEWYFNPAQASSGTTIFSYECDLQYAVNGDAMTVPIRVWKPVVISPALQDIVTCTGAFRLEANTLYAGDYAYQWSPAAPLQQPDMGITAGFISTMTTFVVTATDYTSGCTGSDTVTVTRGQIPQVTVTPEITRINARETVPLYAQGADQYTWYPAKWLDNDASSNPSASPRSPITYTVIGRNKDGCTDSAQVHIDINESTFIPNAFSPNGDGLNDVFKIENFGYQSITEFNIFNRWGQRVFQTIDGTKGWNGTYKGQPADVGTYYYYVNYVADDDNSHTFKGEIILLR